MTIIACLSGLFIYVMLIVVLLMLFYPTDQDEDI